MKKISPSRLGPKASSRKKPSVILGAVGQAAPLVPPCVDLPPGLSFFFLSLRTYGYRPGVLPPRWLGIPAGLRFSSPCRTYGYRPGVLFTEGLLSGLGIPAGLRFFFFFSAAES
jgi:hypothetical protein